MLSNLKRRAKYYEWFTSATVLLIQDSLEKQLQRLESKLQKQDGHQREWLEAKLSMQCEQMKERSEQLEAMLEDHSGKQREQFQEGVRQLSECHKVFTVYCTMVTLT